MDTMLLEILLFAIVTVGGTCLAANIEDRRARAAPERELV